MTTPQFVSAPARWIATIAFVSSFIFPGVRINEVPVSPASIVALLFIPGVWRYYERKRWANVLLAFVILVSILSFNSIRFGFELRNFMYLLIPLSAVGSVVIVKKISDAYGMSFLVKMALSLCILNFMVMLFQSSNIFEINDRFSFLWESSIDFVSSNPREKEILLLTLAIRPSGFFPTGIFASLVIYIVSRGVYVSTGKSWPLLLALFSILISANRTLAVIFVAYESISMARNMELKKYLVWLLVVIGSTLFIVFISSALKIDLYLLKFLNEEWGSGITETASVTERLKTFDFFVAYFSDHAILGGFSSSALAGIEHVFDSELMLRTLQFGIVGVVCLIIIILVPRAGPRTTSWLFLFAIAFLSSLTTTLTTSLVCMMALAFYKECVIRADFEGSEGGRRKAKRFPSLPAL